MYIIKNKSPRCQHNLLCEMNKKKKKIRHNVISKLKFILWFMTNTGILMTQLSLFHTFKSWIISLSRLLSYSIFHKRYKIIWYLGTLVYLMQLKILSLSYTGHDDHLKCWIGLAVEFQELWIIKKETNKKNLE